MSLYVIVASSDAEKAEARIKDKFEPQNILKVDDKTWFVDAPTSIVTPKELFEYIELQDGSGGRVLVFPLTSYYGFHVASTWDWLTAKRA